LFKKEKKMEIKLSKSKWEELGKKAGWIKQSEDSWTCRECGESNDSEKWTNETGVFKGCPNCGSKYVNKNKE
jgi:DNA-directed RNA polymerase subunit RPC12/RpoP